MTTIDPVIALTKLDAIVNYLERLRRFDTLSLDDYLNDFDKQLIIERLLHLIIQTAIEVNEHLLKQLRQEIPRSNFETFAEVSRCGVITMELAEQIAPSAGLRNRLAHNYDDVDPVKVYPGIRNALLQYPIYIIQVRSYLASLEDSDA